jgi:hypothetical protein
VFATNNARQLQPAPHHMPERRGERLPVGHSVAAFGVRLIGISVARILAPCDLTKIACAEKLIS